MLIAKKPCRFGGKQFFIGDEIPGELVLSPKAQQALGVLEIREDKPTKRAAPAKAEPKNTEPEKAKGKKAEKGAGEA